VHACVYVFVCMRVYAYVHVNTCICMCVHVHGLDRVIGKTVEELSIQLEHGKCRVHII
jgi:hypothetical protein